MQKLQTKTKQVEQSETLHSATGNVLAPPRELKSHELAFVAGGQGSGGQAALQRENTMFGIGNPDSQALKNSVGNIR